ncbi:MAG: penicillin acylase family protein [Burkholderiales bacterium]|nr:penicillin acylase family protein [Burkholderiales bacterium]
MNLRPTPFAFQACTRLLALSTALLAACASPPAGTDARTATIARTANGVAHISAPDPETLAYAMAYAYAQDNVCMTADQLVTVRGERSRYFGGSTQGLLARRMFPNEQIDFFIAAHMDDAALERAWGAASAESQALARGAVAGYNRYLADQAGKLPAACNGQAWVKPMTLAEFRRQAELTAVQAATAALADAMLDARPPAAATSAVAEPVTLADAAEVMREAGLLDSPLGSNAWAFGKDTTANGSGLLLGNPHFPWAGVNRFWQVHLTIPGNLDVMGVGIGNFPNVTIGFNKDVAWSHTVSTGKRFTLHELTLAAGDPTSYMLDGQAVKMTPRSVSIQVPAASGALETKTRTVWLTRWGPVVVIPRAGLNWSAKTAYALKDANLGNVRATDSSLGFGRARNVQEVREAMRNIGTPWVNTLAADRNGNVLYADVSVVPDVDAAQLQRCAPSKPAAALLGAAGLVVLDGSRSDCDWKRDPASPQPGLIPMERMPTAVRSDWIHNSNDSFVHTNPAQKWSGISPLVGDASVSRPRTRAGLTQIPELLSRGKVTPEAVQRQLFENRNFMASVVVPDLLAACASAPTAQARDGCAALRGWDQSNNVEARGAHLFREFWRVARTAAGVHRVPFDVTQPATTPTGLNMADAAVAAKVWDALTKAVDAVRKAGFALDATLGSVQRPLITNEAIALHGGDEFEGVLNNLGNQFAPGISAKGLPIDYGSSYIQSVTFDARGPVAQGILTYGQSTDPASAHANDQMRLFSRKEWPVLPFHAEDVAKARVGDVLRLTRP